MLNIIEIMSNLSVKILYVDYITYNLYELEAGGRWARDLYTSQRSSSMFDTSPQGKHPLSAIE